MLQRAKTVGLPANLDTSAFIAIALALESVVDRKYSFAEEQHVIDWCIDTDSLLAGTATHGTDRLKFDPDAFDPRLERYVTNFLNGEPLQFIRVEAYAVLLWIECNRGFCDQEEWVLSKIAEILTYLDSANAYSRAQKPMGSPGSPWDPDYNPANQQGLSRKSFNAPRQPGSRTGMYVDNNQQNPGPPPPPVINQGQQQQLPPGWTSDRTEMS